GASVPYRAVSSRAVWCLWLRHDNADIRLTEHGHRLGLISDERYERFTEKVAQIESERKRLFKTIMKINDEEQAILKEANSTPLKDATRATELLKRPEVTYGMIERMTEEQDSHPEVKEQVEIQIN